MSLMGHRTFLVRLSKFVRCPSLIFDNALRDFRSDMDGLCTVGLGFRVRIRSRDF